MASATIASLQLNATFCSKVQATSSNVLRRQAGVPRLHCLIADRRTASRVGGSESAFVGTALKAGDRIPVAATKAGRKEVTGLFPTVCTYAMSMQDAFVAEFTCPMQR